MWGDESSGLDGVANSSTDSFGSDGETEHPRRVDSEQGELTFTDHSDDGDGDGDGDDVDDDNGHVDDVVLMNDADGGDDGDVIIDDGSSVSDVNEQKHSDSEGLRYVAVL